MSHGHLTGENLPHWIPFGLTTTGTVALILATEMLLVEIATAPSLEPPVVAVAAVTPAPPPAVTPASPEPEPSTPVGSRDQQSGRSDEGEPSSDDRDQERDCPPLFIVHFRLGEATPEVEDLRQKARALASWLDERESANLVIAGHADAVGTEERNLALSFHRARAVARLLKAAGAPSARLTARAFGEYQPLTSEADQSAPNRRVEMHVRGYEHCSAEATKGGAK